MAEAAKTSEGAREDNARLVPLLLLLSATTGLVDAASVLGLGKVFTANMTGNVVFLGFAIAGVPGYGAATFVVAITAFLTGAVIAGRTGSARRGGPLRVWLFRAAVIEAALLLLGAILALGYRIETMEPAWAFYAIIVLTALAMGMRNATVRALRVPDLTTTVLTMTLTGLAADSRLAGGANANWSRRLGAVVCILVGALVGAALLIRFGLWAPLALAAALALVGIPLSRRM